MFPLVNSRLSFPSAGLAGFIRRRLPVGFMYSSAGYSRRLCFCVSGVEETTFGFCFDLLLQLAFGDYVP